MVAACCHALTEAVVVGFGGLFGRGLFGDGGCSTEFSDEVLLNAGRLGSDLLRGCG